MQRIPTLMMCAALGFSTLTSCKPGGDAVTEAPQGIQRGDDKVRATDIDLGRSINADKTIKDKERTFKPNDTIYASVDTRGESGGAVVHARVTYKDGQQVFHDSVTIAPDGKEHTEFHFSKPDGFPKGEYTVEIQVGSQKPKQQTFQVK